MHTEESLSYVPRLGLETATHRRPFECSTNVCRCPPGTSIEPTAQTSLDEYAATPKSRVPNGRTVVTHQFVPSQCSISHCPPFVPLHPYPKFRRPIRPRGHT